jgi:hypothetical protein
MHWLKMRRKDFGLIIVSSSHSKNPVISNQCLDMPIDRKRCGRERINPRAWKIVVSWYAIFVATASLKPVVYLPRD